MKYTFTEEQIDAVRTELAQYPNYGLVSHAQHAAARLILQARAERDEALEKAHHFEKWFGFAEASTNAHWKDLCEVTGERDAALAGQQRLRRKKV